MPSFYRGLFSWRNGDDRPAVCRIPQSLSGKKKKKKNVEKGQGANVQAERLEPDQN